MVLELEWLGTGSAMNYELGNSNFLLRQGDKQVLVDLSANNANMLLHEQRLAGIEHVIITHVHGDHCDGLEGLGFYSWNALNRREEERPKLYVGSQAVYEGLRRIAQSKMSCQQNPDQTRFKADLDHYYEPRIGTDVRIKGLPKIVLFRTEHVWGTDCFGVHVPEYGLWISGDSREVKELPEGTTLAFRDASGSADPTRVHANLEDMKGIPEDERGHTYLYHLNGNWKEFKRDRQGFRGFAMPGDLFEIKPPLYYHNERNRFTHDR